jgi:hypothetical protein
MNTCGTCKYFGEKLEGRYHDDVDDIVESDFHVCDLILHNEDGLSKWPVPAYVIDGSGYYASLCVREEFGCNQWKAK